MRLGQKILKLKLLTYKYMYKQLLKLVCPEIKYNMYHTCMWEIQAANLITQWILQFGQTTCQHI